MLNYKEGTLDGDAQVGDRLIAGGIAEGAMVTGVRWRLAAGPDPTGEGSEWIWKLIQTTPAFTPPWIFDGPAVDTSTTRTDTARLDLCVEDAQRTARQFHLSNLMAMAAVVDGEERLDKALSPAQGAFLWDEVEEWLDSVHRYLQ